MQQALCCCNPVMTTKIYIIHGVGSFDEDTVRRQVTSAATRHQVSDVHTFNWDREVGRSFFPGSFKLDVGVLSETSLGMLNSANRGFLRNHAYCGIPRWCLAVQNAVTLLPQLCGWVWLWGTIFLPVNAWWMQDLRKVVLGVLAAFTATLFIGACVALTGAAFRVSLRRFVLTLAWPYLHLLAIPLGFGLIFLFIQFALLPAQG